MSNHKNKLIVIPNEDKTFHEKLMKQIYVTFLILFV